MKPLSKNSSSSYTAIDIASFFIKREVSPLKLQKLLYYSQVWFFVKNDEKLFQDRIQAWIYGPVVYQVWSNFRYMKRSSVIPRTRASEAELDDLTLQHLEEVWNSYGHLSGSELVDLTHNDLPWKNSRKGLLNDQPSEKEVVINKDTTTDFRLDSFDRIPTVSSINSLGHYSNF